MADELLDFFKTNPTYFLSTVDEDGNPQVRPFATFAKLDGAYYIQTGRTKSVATQIAAHPRVAICGCSQDGSQWMRLEADAVDTHDASLEQRILDEYPELASMYKAGDGNTAAIRLDNVSATLYSFTDAPRTLA